MYVVEHAADIRRRPGTSLRRKLRQLNSREEKRWYDFLRNANFSDDEKDWVYRIYAVVANFPLSSDTTGEVDATRDICMRPTGKPHVRVMSDSRSDAPRKCSKGAFGAVGCEDNKGNRGGTGFFDDKGAMGSIDIRGNKCVRGIVCGKVNSVDKGSFDNTVILDSLTTKVQNGTGASPAVMGASMTDVSSKLLV